MAKNQIRQLISLKKGRLKTFRRPFLFGADVD